MPVQLTRMVGVCLVVALAVAAIAAPPVSATIDTSERLNGVVQDDDRDEDDEDDEDDEGEDDEDRDGESQKEVEEVREEFEEERTELQEKLQEKRSKFEEEKQELREERRELKAEGEWEENKDEWEEDMQKLRAKWAEERKKVRSKLEEEREELQEELAEIADEQDERENDGGSDRQEDVNQPEPTPTSTPAPTPTATQTPTPTPSPTPTNSDHSSNDGDGTDDFDGNAPSVGEEDMPSADVSVASISHEIGGFQAVRSVSTDRSTITAGERVEIVVTVENVNEDPIEVPIELTAFGEVVGVENVTVPGKSTERVRFVQQFDAPGTYQPSVGDESATVRVQPNSDTTTSSNTTVPTGQVGFGALAALLALLLATLAAGRQ